LPQVKREREREIQIPSGNSKLIVSAILNFSAPVSVCLKAQTEAISAGDKMFKMGCMARKILAPGSSSSSNENAAGGETAAGKNRAKRAELGPGGTAAKLQERQPEKKQQMGPLKADELGDFSKLEEDPRLPLNKRQIFKITKSWKAIARTMSKTGTAMFLNLFEQNRDLFYLFDRFQHLKGQQELHESMELREHAATVMSTLDQSINSLSDYDNFITYLHSIGQLHRKVPGFQREFFWVSFPAELKWRANFQSLNNFNNFITLKII